VKKLAAIICAVLAVNSPTRSAETDPFGEIGELLAGCWAIEASEVDSRGEGFEQSGFVSVTLLADRSLLLHHRYNVLRSSGRYDALPRARRFADTLSYDANRRLFVFREADGVSQGSAAALSPDGRTLLSRRMFHHPALDMALLLDETFTIVRRDEVRIRQDIKSAFHAYTETYTANWRRSDPARCAL
jgi:hypothetical protein